MVETHMHSTGATTVSRVAVVPSVKTNAPMRRQRAWVNGHRRARLGIIKKMGVNATSWWPRWWLERTAARRRSAARTGVHHFRTGAPHPAVSHFHANLFRADNSTQGRVCNLNLRGSVFGELLGSTSKGNGGRKFKGTGSNVRNAPNARKNRAATALFICTIH